MSGRVRARHHHAGEAYVEQGRVLRIVNGDGDGVEATVRGSGRARYRVNVSAPEPGEPLVRFECDCPYAAELEPCKHMWAERAGGPQALLDRFMAAIGDSGADVIYTLDPRHGSYCHPSHRAVGALVVQAVVELGIPLERVHLLAGNTADVPGAFGRSCRRLRAHHGAPAERPRAHGWRLDLRCSRPQSASRDPARG